MTVLFFVVCVFFLLSPSAFSKFAAAFPFIYLFIYVFLFFFFKSQGSLDQT